MTRLLTAEKVDSGAVTNYQFNAANGMTLQTPSTGAVTTSSFDANGNLTLENSGGSLTSYSWDSENRLLGAAYPTGQFQTMSYAADGLRRTLVQPTANGLTSYVYDTVNLLYQVDLVTYPTQYTHKPEDYGGRISQSVLSVSSFYGFDGSSNTRILTASNGTNDGSYVYKAFGEELVAAAVVNPFQFGGRYGYFTDWTNRNYVEARHLRNDLGRWISRDPISFGAEDWNPNRYVLNNPTTFVDPTGFIAFPMPQLPSLGSCWDECDSKHDVAYRACNRFRFSIPRSACRFAVKTDLFECHFGCSASNLHPITDVKRLWRRLNPPDPPETQEQLANDRVSITAGCNLEQGTGSSPIRGTGPNGVYPIEPGFGGPITPTYPKLPGGFGGFPQ